MLNEMRFGQLSAASIARFRSLSRPIHYEDGMMPTELYGLVKIQPLMRLIASRFPMRHDVDRSNSGRLDSLSNEKVQLYHAIDGGSIQDKAQRDKILSNFMAPTTLLLRKNAQVMISQLVQAAIQIVSYFGSGNVDQELR